jgi:hypothetical protein
MINVRYVSAASNPSGYGSAARNYITALFVAGVNVTCETISQMPENTNYGITGNVRKSLEGRQIDHDVNIIHLTPDLYPDYMDSEKYNIGHLFFETDKLPKEWIRPCNRMDELWVASEQQADMMRKSGVKVPMYAFAQPIETQLAYEKLPAFAIDQPRDFIFYSCFQWILRKNPKGLLQAYWKEFSGNDQVTLLIKTYRTTYISQEYDTIKKDILAWKGELKLKHYPKVYIVHRLLTDREMIRFHRIGDVFVNPSSGEGWNRVMQEAMLLGKPAISGDNGGITDLLTSQHYYRVTSSPVQAEVSSSIPWYTADMKWKQVDEKSLRTQMKALYKAESTKAENGQKYILNNHSFQTVGKLMAERLEAITRV